MPLRIQLANSDCRPGQLLDVTAHWDFETPPSNITLELGWRTSGKGTEDSESVFEEKWTPDTKSGSEVFQIHLPRGPISVRGNFVSIDWILKCSSKQPNETCSKPILLSHLDGPVLLTSLIP